jgi:trehalose 6-phosphate phosphatase
MSAAPELDKSERHAVFLDFDGTLVDIASKPDRVSVPESLLTTIQSVHDRLDGALALVSGRSIADLDALVDPLHLPIAGVHGIEHRDGFGKTRSESSTVIPENVREHMRKLAESDAGLILEDKGISLALHYRLAPERESFIRADLEEIFTHLGQDFILQDGKMVLELRPAGASKGTAVRKFMSSEPFAGRRPIFIGDDITDEDAFEVVNELGGYSVKVGPRDQATLARFELKNVAAVRDWLKPLA